MPERRRWPNRPDEGSLQTAQFPRISIHKIPSPTTCVVHLLPKRARVFQSLISFINLTFLVRSNQLVLFLFTQGEGGWKPDEGLLPTAQFPRFSVHKIPSPTTFVVPPLPKRARVFQSLTNSTICHWAMVLESLISSVNLIVWVRRSR